MAYLGVSPTQMVQMIEHYREFARTVMEEDSGLAVWTDPRFEMVSQLASYDEKQRLEADEGVG